MPRTKKPSHRVLKTRKRNSRLVTAAWIVQNYDVHQSAVEPAWKRGELGVCFLVESGSGKLRPIFSTCEVARWAKERSVA